MKKSRNVVYGFVDESGTAGVSTADDDYLVLSLVLFTQIEKQKIRPAFVELRQNLGIKKDYEFHYSRNKPRVREAVFRQINMFDFKFYTFAIKKDNIKRHASYASLAEELVKLFVSKSDIEYIIKIDKNPVLIKNLNELKKKYSIKKVKFSEGDSKKEDTLQLADYVVSSHAKIIRHAKESNFDLIKSKMVKTKIIIYN